MASTRFSIPATVVAIVVSAEILSCSCASQTWEAPPIAPLDFSTPEARAEIEGFLHSAKPELRFKDSYLHEIAAYELDKLLDLGMVPPTVERRIGRSIGCVQLWLGGTITETERKKQSLVPPNIELWNQQMFKVRLFHQLIDDTDYSNISNLLVDEEFNIYIIDSSRAFRFHHSLRKPESLQRFSRSLLASLVSLELEHVRERLGGWLSKEQITALLARRDLIIARARARVTEFGEDGVLYP